MSAHTASGQPASSEAFEVKWQMPRSPRSAGRARALLREQLTAWKIDGEVADTAELLLSELVTNSIQHAHVPAGREIGVRIAHYEGLLRIEVADANTKQPAPCEARADDEGGRGLALVIALSERWGCCPRAYGIGKAVWVELRLPQSEL
ncbi:ATP-binding protein [Streptomyces sp. NPDC059063]|uniref:ATP-binding protein n=1 Tax=unclassified Streptomyces TaxID=2593676 RepID=UPI0036B7A36D